MFTMLFYVLSFKDNKCFWNPYFCYFVTIELFSLLPFELLASTLFISLCHLYLVSWFCVSPCFMTRKDLSLGV